MAYNVTEIAPVPVRDVDIQREIRAATNSGEELVCIEIDASMNRLLIVTKDSGRAIVSSPKVR